MDALPVYEALAERSQAMLAAARRGDWDVVIELEQACSRTIDSLRVRGDAVPVDPTARERKAGLIRRILADDAEIRGLAQPRLEALGRMLNAGAVRDRIERTYG